MDDDATGDDDRSALGVQGAEFGCAMPVCEGAMTKRRDTGCTAARQLMAVVSELS